MTHHVNFVAVLSDSVTEEFDKPPEELSKQELENAAEEYFDSLTESELRSLYRNGPISIDDVFEEPEENPDTGSA
jgi:hypothetical protein